MNLKLIAPLMIVGAAVLGGCDNNNNTPPPPPPAGSFTPPPPPGPGPHADVAKPPRKPSTSTPSMSSSSSDTPMTPVPAPDNSGVNTRDRAPDAPTAGMAGQTKPDVQLAADIRKRVMDTELSVTAKNSKIVVQDGKVVLRGPVNTQAEKDSIGAIAADVAGAGNVENQLEVKPAETSADAEPKQ
ncbi:MAG: BON domain-containing protein [Planctomycetota bacterium]|nr:BON domain-containing protein [Planctomycetota bacterium]